MQPRDPLVCLLPSVGQRKRGHGVVSAVADSRGGCASTLWVGGGVRRASAEGQRHALIPMREMKVSVHTHPQTHHNDCVHAVASFAHKPSRYVHSATRKAAQRSDATRVSATHARLVGVRVCLHATHVTPPAQTHSCGHTRRTRTKHSFPSSPSRCVLVVPHEALCARKMESSAYTQTVRLPRSVVLASFKTERMFWQREAW